MASNACCGFQDKLDASEQLGDMLKQAGDREAALKCYQKANIPQKVIEGLAAKGDFEELTRFSGQQVCLLGLDGLLRRS